MFQAGWTKPAFVENSTTHLQAAMSRYYLYLKLIMSMADSQQLSPSPDIDFVWHTHQLGGSNYRCASFQASLLYVHSLF
jgi:hypothetical protein